MARIGVLALQGAFEAQAKALRRVGHEACEVRQAEELESLDGLVLPGGESTTQLKLIRWGGMLSALERLVASGRPVLGACAGLILAASEVREPAQESFGWLDVSVERNHYGRQLDSFEGLSDAGTKLVFIRAPHISRVGQGVHVLETFAGEPVLVRQGNIVGACYHPELSDELGIYRELFG